MNKATYTADEIAEAYLAWVNVPHDMTDLRMIAWDHYVDRRDGLTAGTTRKRREADAPRGDARVIWMDLDG